MAGCDFNASATKLTIDQLSELIDGIYKDYLEGQANAENKLQKNRLNCLNRHSVSACEDLPLAELKKLRKFRREIRRESYINQRGRIAEVLREYTPDAFSLNHLKFSLADSGTPFYKANDFKEVLLDAFAEARPNSELKGYNFSVDRRRKNPFGLGDDWLDRIIADKEAKGRIKVYDSPNKNRCKVFKERSGKESGNRSLQEEMGEARAKSARINDLWRPSSF